jgi:hypothetical protein
MLVFEMSNQDILKDVDGFLEKTGMAESTLGRKALNDGKAITRLRAGKRMWPETIDKLREFMTAESQRPVSPEPEPLRVAE